MPEHSLSASRRGVVVLAMVLAAFVLGSGVRRLLTGRHVDEAAVLPQTREFPVFGTYARLTFWAPSPVASKALDQVTDELLALHRTLNLFDPESELARLNASAAEAPFVCSPELWDVLGAARRAWRDTDGLFDVSIGPLMRLWGFHGKRSTLPDAAEIAAARARVGLNLVAFADDERSVRFNKPGMYLDFGGIAKGYALDRAAAIAARGGIRSGLIDLGGNVRCLAEPPPGHEAYVIGIRDPFETDTLLGTVEILDGAVATSGNYETFVKIEGRVLHHIVDPRNGEPVPDVAGVTVIATAGVDSDVYSTAVFVGGTAVIVRLLETHPGTRVLRIRGAGAQDRRTESFAWKWLEAPAAPRPVRD